MGMTEDKFVALTSCEKERNEFTHTWYSLPLYLAETNVLVGSSHIRSIQIDVCVCVLSSQWFWTPSSLGLPAGVTQEEGHTGFLVHLPSAVRAYSFSRLDRGVEFCVLTI